MFDLKPLARALRTLEADQGRIARKNARRRVSAAISALTRQVDKAYPKIAKPKAPPRSAKAIRRDRILNGYVLFRLGWLFDSWESDGLPLRRQNLGTYVDPWVPGWALSAYLEGYGLRLRPDIVKLHKAGVRNVKRVAQSNKLICAHAAAARMGALLPLVQEGAISCPTT